MITIVFKMLFIIAFTMFAFAVKIILHIYASMMRLFKPKENTSSQNLPRMSMSQQIQRLDALEEEQIIQRLDALAEEIWQEEYNSKFLRNRYIIHTQNKEKFRMSKVFSKWDLPPGAPPHFLFNQPPKPDPAGLATIIQPIRLRGSQLLGVRSSK